MSDNVQEILNRFQIHSLYYHCHIKNAHCILLDGEILSRNLAKKRGIEFADISDLNVQFNRTRWHDYVPLYFSKLTPTLYVQTVRAGNRPVVTPNDEIVFFDVNPVPVFRAQGRIFTDGNAAHNNTKSFHDVADLDKLDWQSIRAPNHYKVSGNLVYDKEFKRKKSSEVLVPDRIPLSMVKRLTVASESAKQIIKDFCIGNNLECVVDVGPSKFLESYYFWYG